MEFSLILGNPVIRRIVMCLPIFLLIRKKLRKLVKLSAKKKLHGEAEKNVGKYDDTVCVGNANAIDDYIEDVKGDVHEVHEVEAEEEVEQEERQRREEAEAKAQKEELEMEEGNAGDIEDEYADEMREEVKVERGGKCGDYVVIHEGEDDGDDDDNRVRDAEEVVEEDSG
ncbi:hypothetical protein EWB00_002900 [Schistosoma japonicum]|uniref:Uncharacterized protein n=1 Tax=Schistosoma japonicum TaxID=6182 RepID=A0A4Z2DW64_SCHJA|nr:hypothetical protein EWB00_002900 [Schistosoma japonicum]